jgi:lipoprotein NlpI
MTDYDEALKLDPTSIPALNSRGDFYRNQGDFSRAMADYDRAVEKQPNDMIAYGNRALIRFYQGEFAKAYDDFKRVTDARPNAYPVLLLFPSKSRDGDAREAKNELTKSAAKLKAGEWPYPIVELYLGKKSVQAAEGLAKTPGEKCEAQFYIGEWHLLRKDRSEAAKALQAAADSCPKDFVENRAAVEELKRLK